MSKMSALHQDIFTMLEKGYRPIRIATILEVPVSWIYEVIEQEGNVEDYNPFSTVNS